MNLSYEKVRETLREKFHVSNGALDRLGENCEGEASSWKAGLIVGGLLHKSDYWICDACGQYCERNGWHFAPTTAQVRK